MFNGAPLEESFNFIHTNLCHIILQNDQRSINNGNLIFTNKAMTPTVTFFGTPIEKIVTIMYLQVKYGY